MVSLFQDLVLDGREHGIELPPDDLIELAGDLYDDILVVVDLVLVDGVGIHEERLVLVFQLVLDRQSERPLRLVLSRSQLQLPDVSFY